MKKIYIFSVLIGCLMTIACQKDHSTDAHIPLPSFAVSGMKDTITLFTFQDTMRITPSIQDTSLYDIYWTNVNSAFLSLLGNKAKTDTIGRYKDLVYPVFLDPGQYYVVLHLRDKKTGLTKLITTVLNVSTLNNDGWYLLKDNNGKTDIDFIHQKGRIDNWIAYYNNGKSLEGNAVNAVFAPSCKLTVSTTDQFNGLMVLSEKDAGLFRISNGLMIYNFDNMFFGKPATRKLQNVFQPMNTNNLTVINDGRAYMMTKGALFTDMPQTYTRLSSWVGVASMDLGWDQSSKSIIFYNGIRFATPASNGEDLKNMKADLKWLTGYAGQRSVALALFKTEDGKGVLFKINALYQYLSGSEKALIMARDTIELTHGLMNANIIGGNYDSDFIYYAVGNKIYMTDVATVQERLQVTLPAGETVTAIQHVKYPQPVNINVPSTTDCLAIATYANGRYKVYIHKISSTGTIQPVNTPSFEGDGRVKTIIYMEKGAGSRVF